MIPAQGSCSIAPGHLYIKIAALAFEIEYIFSEITTQVQTVFFTQSVIGLQVGIIKIIATPFCIPFEEWFGDDIDISSATGDHKGTFIFYDRAFQGQARGYKPDTTLSAKLFIITIFHVHIQY
ncbi:hypothetical protein D3C86_1482420 [compost metagenome]